jgi:predicted Zn-dependent protease
MYHFLRLSISLFLSILLISCATTERHTGDQIVDEPASYKYAAWQLNGSREFEAINVLLNEADMLIENNSMNAAADKLERVLRIKPEYAPAWSRLSWLALQMNTPERSLQMAKRSNSFAQSNPELQLLNWSFIRAASQQLNDEESYFRANQKIEQLKAF